MTQDIEEVLAARKGTHGAYKEHASISQSLKYVMRHHSNWNDMPHTHQEALDMIAHKIARIIAGDPNFLDHWTDIVGYSELVRKELVHDK